MNKDELILSKIPAIREDLDFEIKNNLVVIYSDENHLIQKILRKLGAKIPQKSSITMDEYSSFVFRLIDGKKTIKEIGIEVEKEFGEVVLPLYERLIVFIEYIVYQKEYAIYI